MSIFSDSYGIRMWVPVTAILLVLALIGSGIGLAVASGGLNCPKGQSLHLVTMIPVMVGKVIVMSPIYACEAP